ncbi:hypothetical protein FACS1894190_07670 [Spirochaetia bacterium]|nr:hypothetical protein FACS1894190_07670 [Spirochaetia bacterium]GHV19616.1 hypothetical protein FACS189494_01690 [Spirochaetia bacterium]
MKSFKNLVGVLLLSFVLLSFVQAQEVSVEDSYLQQSVEVMIIREQAQSLDRDSKFLALEYLREIIDNGNTGDDVRIVLQGMAMEGILNRVQSEGRVANNFPDVRMKAVEYLGSINSQASVDALIRVMLTDTEPAVLTAAINSLKKIGNNENDDTVNSIAFAFDKQNARHPDNVLAVAVLNAFRSFSEQSASKSPEIYRIALYLSTSGVYAKTVRDYAAKVLNQIKISGR